MALKIELPANGITEVGSAVETAEQSENSVADVAVADPPHETPAKEQIVWPVFLKKATQQAIKEALSAEISAVLKAHGLEHDCCLAILEPQDSIDSFDLDQIFTALNEINPYHNKRVVLFVISCRR